MKNKKITKEIFDRIKSSLNIWFIIRYRIHVINIYYNEDTKKFYSKFNYKNPLTYLIFLLSFTLFPVFLTLYCIKVFIETIYKSFINWLYKIFY